MNSATPSSVIVERVFNAPIEKDWRAITERDQMKQWYFDLKDSGPRLVMSFNSLAQRTIERICIFAK
jgi:uncharacterized protein YndB with AHSA1/START domain